MVIEAIKQKILSLAIRGKLVEQRPEEGTAEELYQQIRAEKEALIKAGRIKKEKPLEPIKEEEIPFEIPKTWKWVRLGEVVNLQSGQDLTPDKYNAEKRGIPYITGASNFVGDGVSMNRWTEKGSSFAYQGELLLTCKGTVGEMAILEETKVHIARQIMSIRAILVDCMYIKIFLTCYIGVLQGKVKGMIPGISRDDVLGALIPIPPEKENQRIVKRLAGLMFLFNEIDDARRKIYSIRVELHQQILQEAIQGKLVEQRPEEGTAEELYQQIRAEKQALIKAGKIKKEKPLPPITEDEIPFDIPATWKWVRLGEIIDFKMGKTPTRGEDQYWLHPDIPWVSIADMIDGGHTTHTRECISLIAADRVFKGCPAKRGTLLMSFKLSIGKTTILDVEAYHNEAIISILPIVDADNLFRNYLFRTLPLIAPFAKTKEAIKGSTLNASSLSLMLIPLPPLIEQGRIVRKLEKIWMDCMFSQ